MQLRRIIASQSREVIAKLLMAADAVLVFAVGLAAFWLRHGLDAAPLPLQSGLLLMAPLMIVTAMSAAGAYVPQRLLNLTYGLKSIFMGETVAVLALLLLGYISKTTEDISRLWVGLWMLLLPLALILQRALLRWSVARLGGTRLACRQIALIGADSSLQRLQEHLSKAAVQHPLDIRFVLDLDRQEGNPLDEIARLCRDCGVPDDFILALPYSRADDLIQLATGLRHYWANIEVCPDQAFIGLPFKNSHTIGGLPVLRLVNRPFEGWQGIMKWCEDKLLSSLLIVMLLPLMGLIALAIKLDSPGPVLFRQQRFGFGNHEITVLKFRSMHLDQCDDGRQQATRQDPRFTRLGHVLRRSSLDELPQLFNVFAGSMSLVGPRPHAVPHNLEFAPLVTDYLSRHRIKPGMTGLAQVNGLRGEISNIDQLRKRVEHDLFYIENWSLELDLIILLRTALIVLSGKNI